MNNHTRRDEFAEFVTANWPQLVRLAKSLALEPDAAADLLQSSLEKAYRRWPTISV